MSWLGNELVKQIHALLKKKHALFYHFHPAGEKLDGLDFPANETTTKCKKGNWKNQKKKTKKSISLCRERMRVNGSFDGIDDDLLATLGRICPRSENKSNQEREREKIRLPISDRSHGVCLCINTWPNAEKILAPEQIEWRGWNLTDVQQQKKRKKKKN